MVTISSVRKTEDAVTFTVNGRPEPVVVLYDDYGQSGILVHVAFEDKDVLGAPSYGALKMRLASEFPGRKIGFRTATDPRFVRAAVARGERITEPARTGAAVPKLARR